MNSCITNKKMYQTPELAEDALIDAQTRFDYPDGSGPIALYKCEDCGYYHLTSKGPMNEKLKQQLLSGSIKRQKEADRWANKLKKR